MRNERDANLALAASVDRGTPAWQRPAPRRRTSSSRAFAEGVGIIATCWALVFALLAVI